MYIDPSTGGQLFQILAIAFTAISGVVLIFSNRIKMFFSRLRRSSKNAAEEEQPTEEE
ncbi:MAG: hypothetical protein P8046_01175 [Anaerolineales bacterium]|jgi:hypothetical protein